MKQTMNNQPEQLVTLQPAPAASAAKNQLEDPALRRADSLITYQPDGQRKQTILARPALTNGNMLQQSLTPAVVAVCKEEDGRYFAAQTDTFTARFNRDEMTNELFSVVKDNHKLTVFYKSAEPAAASLLADKDNCVDFSPADGTRLSYQTMPDGVKEIIYIRQKGGAYRYTFTMEMENLSPLWHEDTQEIHFMSTLNDQEIFTIPAPFMEDAAGAVSEGVSYEVKTTSNGNLQLSVMADAQWIEADDRIFPVAIDPQILLTGSANISTFSYSGGILTAQKQHTVGIVNGTCHRMYVKAVLPTLPANARLTKAELIFKQASGVSCDCNTPAIGIYSVNNTLASGIAAPPHNEKMLDYALLRTGSAEADGSPITYAFDITALLDAKAAGGASTANLVVKLQDETLPYTDNIALLGATSAAPPTLELTYQSTFGVQTDECVHTHSLGRLGTAGVDLRNGNLMLDCEDFAWAGNRMPVTLRHLFTGALALKNFTRSTTGTGPNTADFSAMKLGYGWRLNLMQTMVPKNLLQNGQNVNGYVYIDESGDEHFFVVSSKKALQRCCDTKDEQCCDYFLFEEQGTDSDLLYDPCRRELYMGEQTYLFDSIGRLKRITDAYGNKMELTYTNLRLTSVTDGAGRDFAFNYSAAGQLTSIVAPDGSTLRYTYSGNQLTGISYPNGRSAAITYNATGRPNQIVIKNLYDNPVYRVNYAYTGNRVTALQEYGYQYSNMEDIASDPVAGQTVSYDYSAAARRTKVMATEPADDDAPAATVTTVYTFDANGAMLGSYVYTAQTGNDAGSNTPGSTINPGAGENGTGVVSNVNNLLKDHGFHTLSAWQGEAANAADFEVRSKKYHPYALFGSHFLRMMSRQESAVKNGMYQQTASLPAGDYTFSAYIRPLNTVVSNGLSNPGAYLRVTTPGGTVLGESERLTRYESDFVRLVVPFTLANAGPVQVHIVIDGRMTLHADGAQLEDNTFVNSYNLLENGNFEQSSYAWTFTGNADVTTDAAFNMRHALALTGSVNDVCEAVQTVPVKFYADTRETFTLSGWAKAESLPLHKRTGAPDASFRLAAVITYSDGTMQVEEAAFSPHTTDWQLASVTFSKNKYETVRSLDVVCEYNFNDGVAFFDDIQLTRSSLETLLSPDDFAGQDTSPSQTEDTAPEETEDETEEQPKQEDKGFEEVRDTYGNPLTETTFTDGEFGTLYRSFGYTPDCNGCENAGNDLIHETDPRGNDIHYTVDEATSRNKEVTDRCGNKTLYEYDASGRTTKVTNMNSLGIGLANVTYSYDAFDNMTRISRGDGMSYQLDYNPFHNLESIGIRGMSSKLVSYSYKNGNGRLKQITYANGDKVKLFYNSSGQPITEKWFDSNNAIIAHYKYVFDGHGVLTRLLDIINQIEYTYKYENDSITQIIECKVILNENQVIIDKTTNNSIQYTYDSNGQLLRKTITNIQGKQQNYYYKTSDENDSSTTVTFSSDEKTVTSHSKVDSFGRKIFEELQLGSGFVSRQFSYIVGQATSEHIANNKLKSSPTTQLVSQIILSDGRTLSYEYDPEERITKVIDSIEGTTEYSYNSLGELFTETKNGEIVNKMIYTIHGNMTSKNGVAYTYGNNAWKDLLTKVGDQSIFYDDLGNPVSYLGHTLTWEKGRQLKTFDNIQYTYDANGIRTSKTIDGIRHDFAIDGVTILFETWNNHILIPIYDNEDNICGIIYNDVPFYFLKNLQNDIISIADKNGSVVAKYSYDAWGACTVTQDISGCNIANINPFRYRSYYFDTETNLYYLQSRYYDPVVGRFLNADDTNYFLTNPTTLKTNLFTYCDNSCINYNDPTGHYKVTSFSIPQFLEESEAMVNSLRKTYYPGTIWAIYTIKSNSQFQNCWKQMPLPSILLINTHGNKTTLGEGNNSSPFKFNVNNVKNLNYRNIKLIILLGCNCGMWSGGMGNIAIAFLRKISGVVLASDGTVFSYVNSDTIAESRGDQEWYDQLRPQDKKSSNKNKNKGWVVYHKKKGEVYGRILKVKGRISISNLVRKVRQQGLF